MTNDRTNVPSSPNEMVEAWLKAATDTERRWNEYLNQAMGTERYAEMSSRAVESSAAMQAAFASGMDQYLRAMNIPTHADLAKLRERITALELRVDELTASSKE